MCSFEVLTYLCPPVSEQIMVKSIYLVPAPYQYIVFLLLLHGYIHHSGQGKEKSNRIIVSENYIWRRKSIFLPKNN